MRAGQPGNLISSLRTHLHPVILPTLLGMLFTLVSARANTPVDRPPPPLFTSSPSMERVLEFYQRKDLPMAAALLESIISKPETDEATRTRAALWLSSIQIDHGHAAEAAVRLNLWIEAHPNHPDAAYAQMLLGQAYRNLGAYEQARLSFYQAATTLVRQTSRDKNAEPANRIALTEALGWELAETEYEVGNWERAEELFLRFKEQSVDNEQLTQAALYRLADCSYQQRKPQEAITRYRTAISLGPIHPFATEAWLRLVGLYGELGKPDFQEGALKGFIWVVKNLHEQESAYWQRRGAEMLLQSARHQPEKVSKLLDQLAQLSGDQHWQEILAYYRSWTERKTGQSVAALHAKDDETGGCVQWRIEFDKGLDRLRVRINQLPSPSGAPTGENMVD